MTIRQFTNEELLELYSNVLPLHFPANEMKPLSVMEDMIQREIYLGFGLFRHEKLESYALFVSPKASDFVLLDYLASMEPNRNAGNGSLLLSRMVEFFPDKTGIFIETENPENELQARRLAFYLRNHAIDTTAKVDLFSVPFKLLCLPLQPSSTAASYGKPFPTSKEAFQTNMDAIYKAMFSENDYKKIHLL